MKDDTRGRQSISHHKHYFSISCFYRNVLVDSMCCSELFSVCSDMIDGMCFMSFHIIPMFLLLRTIRCVTLLSIV